MQDVGETRRGAAFGAILAAFDTGIGTGSTMTGWLSGRVGFPTAFAVAAVLAAMALPMFLLVDKRFGPRCALQVPPIAVAAAALGRRPRGLMLRRLLALLLVVLGAPEPVADRRGAARQPHRPWLARHRAARRAPGGHRVRRRGGPRAVEQPPRRDRRWRAGRPARASAPCWSPTDHVHLAGPLPPGVREPVAIATVTWHALWFVWTLRQPTDTASGSSGSDTR